MKYDFTTIIDRRNHDAMAIDCLENDPTPPKEGWNVIPMWIADMSFPTCPTVSEALIERAKHPCFGYLRLSDEYWNSIIDWHKRRNGAKDLERKHISYENGVIGGVLSFLNVVCSKGDNVLLHSPTYEGFTEQLENNGYHMILSDLVQDKDGIYRMDYEDMESKIIEYKIHAVVMCSPHNPTGRVWERAELEKAMEIFERHDVYIASDEIWSDIILPGYKHLSPQLVNEWSMMHSAAFYSTSKTFNLGGLIGSYHIIYNDWLRDRVDKEVSLYHYDEPSLFIQHAVIGGYKDEGHEWVDELNQVISKNADYMKKFLESYDIHTPSPQGTYLLFPDFSDYCARTGTTLDKLEKSMWDIGVSTQDGRGFHGPCHMRINLALPFALIQEACDRLEKFVLVK